MYLDFKNKKLIRLSQIWLSLIACNFILNTESVKNHFDLSGKNLISVIDNCLDIGIGHKEDQKLNVFLFLSLGVLSAESNQKERNTSFLNSKNLDLSLINVLSIKNKYKLNKSFKNLNILPDLRAPPLTFVS